MINRKLLGLWSKSWLALRPRFREGAVKITPSVDDFVTRGLSHWSADWKTMLIGRCLSARPGLFIDVGANIGQTLIDYLKAPVRNGYLGFEPNSLLAAQLSHLISSNDLKDCLLVPSGLSDDNQVMKLLLFGGESDPGATLDPDLRPSANVRPVAVSTYRFDDIASLAPGPISLIKIDVEGHELATLRGMRDTLVSKRPLILCEVLHRDPAADSLAYGRRISELWDFLASCDFEVHRVLISNGRLAGFERMQAFPDTIYSESSRTTCDYFFLPAGEPLPDHS